ncbi:MAG: SprT family zinc-dependent metalloprotease [Pseudomonadota bacterium]
MTDKVFIGTPPIELSVKRSVRAKRYGLRIDPRNGDVILTVPPGGSLAQATAFAETKVAWLRKHLSTASDRKPLAFGDEIYLAGVPVTLGKSGTSRTVLRDRTLYIAKTEAEIPSRLKAFLKVEAQARLVPAAGYYSEMINQRFRNVSFRDTKSRWGSCTSRGDLMFSIRLAMVPPKVAHYVAAHEVCHLLEMNHSSRFWGHVERIFPDYRAQRTWLKTQARAIQAIQL